tara:strand:- start:1047 stop:1274 length:228 start_codon:yes stop_codon:yes gene_type:complete
MNRKLKQLIVNTSIEGATPATLRDSFIRMMHLAGCCYRELMGVTGIKQKENLDRKIKPHHQKLDGVYKSIFSRII